MSSSTLAVGLRHLRSQLAAQQRSGESDEQLLHDFTTRRDDSAFTVLVRRHGPMVLHVCRRVLGHEQDAEDAFQATFLVLAQNAAALRNKTALASWLHGTAYRTAMKAKQSTIRRRKHEDQTQPRPPANPSDELLWREVRALLDEEIARLPESYRSVFVLCCLENLSQTEAGQRLGVKVRTVSNRLAEARKRLAQQLRRRGVELTAVLAATALATPPVSALPVGLMATTIKAALALAAGEKLAGIVSASVAQLVKSATTAMTVGKAKIAVVLFLTGSMMAGASAWAYRGLAVNASTPSRQPAELPAAKADDKPRAASPQREATKTLEIQGRVLDPEGKPKAGARVYLNLELEDEGPIYSVTTAKDGRFALVFPRSSLIEPKTKMPRRTISIVAEAKGCGLDWWEGQPGDFGEVTLRLVKDDVPIQGRILSLEGKPLPGITVSVKKIEAYPKGDLSRALDAQRHRSEMSDPIKARTISLRHRSDPALTATTDADGRFRLDGIGRDRIVTLHLKGPRIHYSTLRVMTRADKSVRGVRDQETIHGATFEYLAKPSRLIRGTVRELGTGKPLAGIRVGSLQTTDYADTDAQGHYELRGCPKGKKYAVVAYPIDGRPYIESSVALDDTLGLDPLTADLELLRGIPFEGKVLDEMGKPVPGRIGYNPLQPNPNVTGNIGGGAVGIGSLSEAEVQADGSFRCIVIPGPGAVDFKAADADRYESACVDVGAVGAKGGKEYLYVLGGHGLVAPCPQEQFHAIALINPDEKTKKITQTLRVKSSPGLQGTVLDSEGKPLAGVRVRGLVWLGDWTALADDKFTVHGVNPLRPRRLYFVHEAKHLIGAVEVKGTETKPLTVGLQPWATLRGRLLDADGRPLRNAKLRGNQFLLEDGRTDGEGRFHLERLIPGLRYDFHYRRDKQPFVSGILLKGFVGKPGEVRELGDVRGQPFREE